MKRHVITILFLILAIAFYALGAAGPGTVFLLIGALLTEGIFWFRIFGKGRSKAK